ACLAGISPSTEEMLNHCRSALPEAKMPKEIIFLESLPKNPRGKLDRGALAELWKRDHPPTTQEGYQRA
ncbi:MAG: acyl-CoA synthetase, partial [Proteobacteria bacterium]|nr:acyl-CoA synthetase [Pseudomonadota bacterium]